MPKLSHIVLAVVAAALVLAVAGCQPAGPPSIVGRWRAADTADKAASLSDLTLSPDGTFRYAGKNALGGPVAFTGTYRTGVNAGNPWVALAYDDYPGKPQVWFYKLDGDKLAVSARLGNLTNGSALVFTKQ